jgi:ABC-2 type transport system ATP-binding protein
VAAIDHRQGAKLESVYKRFARHAPWVLNGVDLVLEPGTGAFVTGTNGSGKSTLLRIVAGLSRPTRGTAKRAPTASYLPERQPESLRMTGSTYLGHFGAIRGLGPVATRSRINDLLGRLGIEPGPDVPIEELSKGNRQKVLVAQALLCPVQLIVLDEPFSGLDGPAQVALNELLAEARDDGSAILVSGHDGRASLDTYRTYEMVDGAAVERADRQPPPPSARMAVTLACREGLDRQTLVSVPGVVFESTSHGTHEDGHPIVAYVERAATDRFLVEAISAGWSVVSVVRTDRDHNQGTVS